MTSSSIIDSKEDKDIIVFTLHKCASNLLHQICLILTQAAGIPYHSPNNAGGKATARTLIEDEKFWQAHHGCFAPIRFYVDVPQINDYKVILHLRDPRDVLVSMYFSYCYIHPGEIKANTGYRKQIADKGIDTFVLAMAKSDNIGIVGDYGTGGHVEDLIGSVLTRYQRYIDSLLGRENVIFIRYEDMIYDFRGWLDKFTMPFPIQNKVAIIEKLVALSPKFFPKRSSDVMLHTRHITPGDHKTKLLPATLQELDDIFCDVLDELGYERST